MPDAAARVTDLRIADEWFIANPFTPREVVMRGRPDGSLSGPKMRVVKVTGDTITVSVEG